MTRAAALIGFAESPENIALVGPQIEDNYIKESKHRVEINKHRIWHRLYKTGHLLELARQYVRRHPHRKHQISTA